MFNKLLAQDSFTDLDSLLEEEYATEYNDDEYYEQLDHRIDELFSRADFKKFRKIVLDGWLTVEAN